MVALNRKGKPGEPGEFGTKEKGGRGGTGGEGGEGAPSAAMGRSAIISMVIAVGVIVTLLLFIHRQSEKNFRQTNMAIDEARAAAAAAVGSADHANEAVKKISIVLARQQNQARRIAQLIDALKEAGIPVPKPLPDISGTSDSPSKPPKGGKQPPPSGHQPPGTGPVPSPEPSPEPSPGPSPEPTCVDIPILGGVCI